MPWDGTYSEDGIAGVMLAREDADLYISWASDPAVNPPGTIYQIYINHQLRGSDAATFASVPGLAAPDTDLIVHIGKVSVANRDVDYSALLEPVPGGGNRARVTWFGGSWLDSDLEGFRVYLSETPGGPVNRAEPVGTVPAILGPLGYGRGPYGRGPYGRSATPFEWTSAPLRPGSWEIAVAAFDRAGNESPGTAVVTQVIAGPPAAPPEIGGRKLWVDAYDPASGVARLRWNPNI